MNGHLRARVDSETVRVLHYSVKVGMAHTELFEQRKRLEDEKDLMDLKFRDYCEVEFLGLRSLIEMTPSAGRKD